MDLLRGSPPSHKAASFEFTNATGATITEGDLVMIQETVGVLYLDIQYNADGSKADKECANGETGVLYYNAEKIILPKLAETGLACLPGDKLYWSGVAGTGVSPTWTSGWYWIAICVRAAAELDTTVMADLKGDKASITEPL